MITDIEVQTRVERVIRECLGLDPEEDISGNNLVLDLGADELDVVEIALGIEEEFETYNLTIDEDDVEKKLETVYDLMMYVCDKLGVGGY